ncbi:MAG: 2-hydroxyacid dehydrogenase [Clostridiaceae bacterium]|nr:2-hydroxyacid dehydrogenase [Clostridiaceae bacterium]
MAKPKCVITAEVVEPYLSQIKELCDVTVCGWASKKRLMPEEELIGHLKGAEVFIVEFEQVTRRVIGSCPDLKLVMCVRGNPVNVDAAACTARGIPLLFAPGRNANSVAEYIVGAMISLVRSIARSYHEIRNGRFLGEPKEDIYDVKYRDDMVWSMNTPGANPYLEFKGFEVYGKTFGMVGYGAVGRKLSGILLAMGMRVMAFDPYVPPEELAADGIEPASMEDVFSRSDFVSIQCKVTEETKGMIGPREFSLMKPTAIFINTARAVIVDQKALMDALTEKRIAGAVLDVFWEEPLPSNHPLLGMDNVLITPHIAGASRDVPVQHSLMVVDEVSRYVKGESPKRLFNRDVMRNIE